MPKPPSSALLERFAPLRFVPTCPEIVAYQALDVFALWEAWEEESGERQSTPFWAIAWPGAIALARALHAGAFRVQERRVLELGCGGAVAALAAARAGARPVVANDIDPVALHVARLNAEANRLTLEYDDRDLGVLADPPGADLVLAADLFYLKSHAAPLLGFLQRLRKRGADVVVADGGRDFTPRQGLEKFAESLVPADRAAEGVSSRPVRLLRVVV